MSCHLMACLSWSPSSLPGRVIGARELPLRGPNNEDPTVGPAPATTFRLEGSTDVLWLGLGFNSTWGMPHR